MLARRDEGGGANDMERKGDTLGCKESRWVWIWEARFVIRSRRYGVVCVLTWGEDCAGSQRGSGEWARELTEGV